MYNNKNTSNERKIKNQNREIKNGSCSRSHLVNKTVGGRHHTSQASANHRRK
jgi:hypothetical protein